MNFRRITRIALRPVNNVTATATSTSTKTSNLNHLIIAKRFGGHGPPTRFGFPHYWSGMVWGPRMAGIRIALMFKFVMLGTVVFFFRDKFPFPAHKYNMQNNMGRMY